MNSSEFQEVAREGHGNGRHSTCLDHQQQYPSIKKCGQGMIDIAQVGVLSADLGHAIGQFRPYERAGESDESAGQPCTQNQPWRVHALSYNIRIDKDARAYGSTHDQHGGVKETQSASKSLRWLGAGEFKESILQIAWRLIRNAMKHDTRVTLMSVRLRFRSGLRQQGSVFTHCFSAA